MNSAIQAIAEPRRREILLLVRDAELSVGEIASHFEVSRPAISQHLRVLRDAGLVTQRKAGTRRLYQVRPEGLEEVRAYLDQFWADHLLRLKKAAEQEARRETLHASDRT